MDNKLMSELANRPESPKSEKQRSGGNSRKPKGEKQTNGDPSSKPFRLQNRYIMLTYKHHIDKRNLREDITERTGLQPTFIRSAHETGDDANPYNHTHCVIDFGKSFQTRNCRFFDIEPSLRHHNIDETIHPHIQTYKNRADFENAKKYIAKEDPDNADLKEKPCMIEGILNQDKLVDALKNYCKKPSDAMGIMAIHALRPADYRTDKDDWTYWKPRPWQEFVIFKIDEKPDGRSVYWIYDQKGKSGKSVLGDYLDDHPDYCDKVYFTDDMGNSRECATIMESLFAGGWRGNTIIVDLTRCTEHHDRMYDYLEKVANGRITSQKYRGKRIKFNKPHVFVMANYLPHYDKMSLDRWQIYEIENNTEIRKMTIDEVKDRLCPNQIGEDSPYRYENIPKPRIIIHKE